MIYASVIVASRTNVQELTYAIPAAIIPYIRVGGTVMVSLRRQLVRGVVIKLVRNAPVTIKGRIKEIESIDRSGAGFSLPQVATIEDLAGYYGASPAEVAYHALAWPSQISGDVKPAAKKPIFIQAPWPERLKFYRQLMAKYNGKRRLIFLLPTSAQADALRAELGGETFGDDLKVAEKRAIDQKLAANEPVTVIGVQKWIFFPLRPSDVLVIDSPKSIGAKSQRRPYMTSKRIGLMRARNEGIQLILGDDLLAVTDYQKKLDKSWRVISTRFEQLPLTIINRHRSPSLLAEPFADKLTEVETERNLVFVAAKGFANVLYCRACQDVCRCPNCGRPAQLKNEQKLVCRFCGWQADRPANCGKTGGELIVLGEGIQLVRKEIEKLLPDTKIIEVSSDNTNQPGKFTIATEKIVSFPQAHFDNLFVASADRMLSGIDPDGSWHLLSILLALRSRVKIIIIQTHFPDHWVWQAVGSGNLDEYYQTELAERKKYRLSPFGQELIVFGRGASETQLKTQAKEIFIELQLMKKVTASEPTFERLNPREYQAKITIYADNQLTPADKTQIRDLLPPSWAIDIGE